MSHSQVFTYDPPLNSAKIERVKNTVRASIPPYDISKLEYFDSMFKSLQDYASRDHQHHNFSLNIAYYETDDIDEETIWKENNVWVKVRVTGGYGDAFRSRYMATHLGVARVDWKRKSLRILKKTSVHLAKHAAHRVIDHVTVGVGHFLAEKLLDAGADEVIHGLEERQHARSSSRLHKVTYSPARIFEQLNAMTAADLRKIRANGKINELSTYMFDALDTDHSETLDYEEFLVFWHKLLNQRVHEALKLYEEVAGTSKQINYHQFTMIFINVLDILTSVKEEAKQHTVSKKMNEAKSLVIDFYKLPAARAQQALASEEDFTQFAAKVFNDIDEDQSETIDKQEFLKFFSSALEIPLEQANKAFQAVAGKSDVINFVHFSAYFKSFIREHLRAENNTLAWTRFVNQWMCMDLEELVELQSDREAAGVVAEKMFEIIHADRFGLTYDQFKVLEAGLNRALYETPETEEKRRIRYASHSSETDSGVSRISKESYVEVILTNMERVTEFKKDWDFARIFDDAIFRLGDDVDLKTLTSLYNRYYSRFTSNSEMNYMQYAKFARCVYIIDMSETFQLERDFTLSLNLRVKHNIESITAIKHENAQFPGKSYFHKIAELPLENLTELVLEDYRLHATAHLIFLNVHPYRPQHNHTTFMLYGQHLCAEFRLQEPMVTEWFNLFAKDQLLSEDGLVLCLKQAIKKLVSR